MKYYFTYFPYKNVILEQHPFFYSNMSQFAYKTAEKEHFLRNTPAALINKKMLNILGQCTLYFASDTFLCFKIAKCKF